MLRGEFDQPRVCRSIVTLRHDEGLRRGVATVHSM